MKKNYQKPTIQVYDMQKPKLLAGSEVGTCPTYVPEGCPPVSGL